ncbi:MAG: hypothetical protein AAFY63_16600 [Cyanobacteria bacterium J06643_13]
MLVDLVELSEIQSFLDILRIGSNVKSHQADKQYSFTEGYGEVVTSPSGGLGESSPNMDLGF